jgi:hypothetical protein
LDIMKVEVAVPPGRRVVVELTALSLELEKY